MKYHPQRETRICLSSAEAAVLLDAAIKILPSIVPMIALQLFASMRRSELSNVRVNTNGVLFLIRRGGDLGRILDSPNLSEWLRCFPVPCGSALERAAASLRDTPKVFRSAKIPFEPGILRQTALTFECHRRLELGRMMTELGLEQPPLMRSPVNACIERADVEAFWNIVPPSSCA